MPFPKLTIPTLVVWALDDVALPACNLDGMEELVPNATIVKVPGCGHFVPWEAPDEVNAAMDAFFERTAVAA
jgi:pimeloyl-ACP methyl ester carboxylesterase